MQGLVTLTSNNQLLIETLLMRTCEENQKDQQLLKQYVAENNGPMAAKILHRLAGSAQVIGLTQADAQCRALEIQCLDTPDVQNLQASMQALHDYLDSFHSAIKAHFA